VVVTVDAGYLATTDLPFDTREVLGVISHGKLTPLLPASAYPDGGSCATGQLAFTAYSVATGKLDRVLYSYTGGCDFADAVVMWAPSTALVIGWILVSKPVTPPPPTTNEIGVVAQGKFTALPSIKLGTGGDEAPSMIAF
jgi:hypothetical protein